MACPEGFEPPTYRLEGDCKLSTVLRAEILVGEEGLEPSQPKSTELKSVVSANFTTRPKKLNYNQW